MLIRDVVIGLLTIALTCVAGSTTATAQDPGDVDPRHYKVLFENGHVRVLQITYGPPEKFVLPDHPGTVTVLLNDQSVRFAYPDDKTHDRISRAGDVPWTPPGKLLPDDIGNSAVELIVVQLKEQTTPPNAAPTH